MTYEWACSAEDILWRRSKLGLRLSGPERAALESYVLTKAAKETV
jgi:glycerol-3-phosphate dehydrogenase